MPDSMSPSAWTTSFLAFLSISASTASAAPTRNVKDSPRPYTVSFDRGLVESTRQKVAFFRDTQPIDAPAWFDGPPASKIKSIGKYWLEEYDWTEEEARINADFDHYITTVPPPGGNYNRSLDIHFIHLKSEREDAVPMLMLHGWPSTSLEWEKVIPGLINPDDGQPAFHVVAPDIPGYGFSPAPTASGFGPQEHGTAFNSIMQQLGYTEYIVYSTDLGFVAALGLLAGHGSNVINHVTDFYFQLPNNTDIARYMANQTSAEESRYIAAQLAFQEEHSAYALLHATLPLSIAYPLNDSPLGFLAWMYQLVYSVADQAYTAKQLITEALLLYLPGVYGYIRDYKETFPYFEVLANGDFPTTSVPTSVLQFGGNVGYPELENAVLAPRDWIERTANVTYFARFDKGAHFPALSVPDLWLSEVRKIFV